MTKKEIKTMLIELFIKPLPEVILKSVAVYEGSCALGLGIGILIGIINRRLEKKKK